jgi:type IV secretory pathway VirB10-like protein
MENIENVVKTVNKSFWQKNKNTIIAIVLIAIMAAITFFFIRWRMKKNKEIKESLEERNKLLDETVDTAKEVEEKAKESSDRSEEIQELVKDRMEQYGKMQEENAKIVSMYDELTEQRDSDIKRLNELVNENTELKKIVFDLQAQMKLNQDPKELKSDAKNPKKAKSKKVKNKKDAPKYHTEEYKEYSKARETGTVEGWNKFLSMEFETKDWFATANMLLGRLKSRLKKKDDSNLVEV